MLRGDFSIPDRDKTHNRNSCWRVRKEQALRDVFLAGLPLPTPHAGLPPRQRRRSVSKWGASSLQAISIIRRSFFPTSSVHLPSDWGLGCLSRKFHPTCPRMKPTSSTGVHLPSTEGPDSPCFWGPCGDIMEGGSQPSCQAEGGHDKLRHPDENRIKQGPVALS